MFRVNPNKIKVCPRSKDGYYDYWVINNPEDIRPYGVILVKG